MCLGNPERRVFEEILMKPGFRLFVICTLSFRSVRALGVVVGCALGSPLLGPGLSQEKTPSVRERALKQFDADRDGRLNVLEREEIRQAGKPFAVKRPRYIRDRRRHRQRLKLYDTNGDGELSEAEDEAAEKSLQRTWNRLSDEYDIWQDDRPVVKHLERLRRDAKQ